jgi:hypothetical protein
MKDNTEMISITSHIPAEADFLIVYSTMPGKIHGSLILNPLFLCNIKHNSYRRVRIVLRNIPAKIMKSLRIFFFTFLFQVITPGVILKKVPGLFKLYAIC